MTICPVLSIFALVSECEIHEFCRLFLISLYLSGNHGDHVFVHMHPERVDNFLEWTKQQLLPNHGEGKAFQKAPRSWKRLYRKYWIRYSCNIEETCKGIERVKETHVYYHSSAQKGMYSLLDPTLNTDQLKSFMTVYNATEGLYALLSVRCGSESPGLMEFLQLFASSVKVMGETFEARDFAKFLVLAINTPHDLTKPDAYQTIASRFGLDFAANLKNIIANSGVHGEFKHFTRASLFVKRQSILLLSLFLALVHAATLTIGPKLALQGHDYSVH